MSLPGRQQPEAAVLRQAHDRHQDDHASGLSPKGEFRNAQHEGTPVNALPNTGLLQRGMTSADLTRVLAIEVGAYSFPWSRGNFIDSLAAGYLAEVLFVRDGGLLGYFVAMPGVDEMHLLNVTVAPDHQGRGHGRAMLDALEARCIERHLPMLWLEVRAGNHRARDVYRQRGFAEVGLRRGYYPAPQGLREDAVVMSMAVVQGTQGAGDGLV